MLIGVVFTGFGVVFLILGVVFLIVGKNTKCTAQVQGRIIDTCGNPFRYNREKDNNFTTTGGNRRSKDGTYAPIYSYYVNGQEYRRASNVSYTKMLVERMMKSPVTVYYNPENPQESKIGKMDAWKMIGITFSGMGILFFSMGVIFLVIGI